MFGFVCIAGWCSANPRSSIEKYGIPCQPLVVGDICLPPNHPEAVRTPDLCDRFRRFEFGGNETEFIVGGASSGQSPLARSVVASAMARAHAANAVTASSTAATAAKTISPPMSPAKKEKGSSGSGSNSSTKDPDKPKRPMNGFMLFAKKYRLELIQQHPGKDNR